LFNLLETARVADILKVGEHIHLSPIWIEIFAAPVAAHMILILILYIFKVPQKFKDLGASIERLSQASSTLSEMVKKLDGAILTLEKRAAVHDRAISDIIGKPYDSRAISEDWTKYPRIHKS
jgi:hypothetical protein